MKTILIACAAAIVIAVVGGVVLDSMQVDSEQEYTTPYVRLGA
jgi:hypothetical protein